MNINKSKKIIDKFFNFKSCYLDKRIVVRNMVERYKLPIDSLYIGMRVYVEETREEFMYTDINTWTLIEYEDNTEIDPESIEKYNLPWE